MNDEKFYEAEQFDLPIDKEKAEEKPRPSDCNNDKVSGAGRACDSRSSDTESGP